MRVVDPRDQTTAAQIQTATGLDRFVPTTARTLDAAFVFLLGIVALFGFATTFDTWHYLVVSAIGLILGITIAHLVRALRWHWTLAVVGAALIVAVFGGPVALRRGLVANVVPTWTTMTELWAMSIHGWKQLVTTLAPVAGTGVFLTLPFILAVFAGASAFALARSYRSNALPLIPLGALFALVIALGTDTPLMLGVQTLTWLALLLAWSSIRASARVTMGTKRSLRPSRFLGGVGILLAAALAASVAGPVLPGIHPPREILRNHVKPPIDLNQYPSPLASFRKFSSQELGNQSFYDKPLLSIDGATEGQLIRFAVLDSYDGLVWGAGASGFRRIGSQIPTVVDGVDVVGEPVNLSVTIGDVYASQAALSIWVPSLGHATTIDVDASHDEALVFDLHKGQALVLDHLRSGDVVRMSTIPVPTVMDLKTPHSPAGQLLVMDDRSAFMAETLHLVTGGSVSRWEQLAGLAQGLQQGYWSDGTKKNESQYTPGHGEARLKHFWALLPGYVGSDEHYAAIFALGANRLGFPARVVFGAIMPKDSTIVTGQDVTAWVEIDTVDGWIAIHPSLFIPDRDRVPEETQQEVFEPQDDIPPIVPPTPKDPPGASDHTKGRLGQQREGKDIDGDGSWWQLPLIGAGAGIGILGLLILGLLAAKAVRANARRHRGGPPNQIAAGWIEVLDRARDLGMKVPRASTRYEQALAIDSDVFVGLAASTDRAMFQRQDPDDTIVTGYWAEVASAKTALLSDRRGLRRFWARINPRSLMPRRSSLIHRRP